MPTRLHRSRKLSSGWVVVVDRALFHCKSGSWAPTFSLLGELPGREGEAVCLHHTLTSALTLEVVPEF